MINHEYPRGAEVINHQSMVLTLSGLIIEVGFLLQRVYNGCIIQRMCGSRPSTIDTGLTLMHE